jgi:hypothetical protein
MMAETIQRKYLFIIRALLRNFFAAGFAVLLTACSADRFLTHEDDRLLSSVTVVSDSRQSPASSYRSCVRQEANSRWFSFLKVPLGLYLLQTSDSTKRFNRFIRHIGEAPVIYQPELTRYSLLTMEATMKNRGFLHGTVTADTVVRNRRLKITYQLHPGLPSYVDSLHYAFDNADVEALVRADSSATRLYRGMPLSADLLGEERNRIVSLLRDAGYYNVHREFVSFVADTLPGDYGVRLTLSVCCPAGISPSVAYRRYHLSHVSLREDLTEAKPYDSTTYRGVGMYYQPRRPKIVRRVYYRHLSLRSDSLYRAIDVQRTYSAINSLQPVNYTAIRFRESPSDTTGLDADIHVQLSKPHSVTAEVEGTNTAGNLGAAVSLSYSNRNVFRGAESLSFKLRGAYEAITGLEGYNNQNYVAYSAEMDLRFPSLLLPFVSERVRQGLKSSSEVEMMYESQDRPEFHRRVLTASWVYRWSPVLASRWQHRLDLLSLNYVFMPWISDTFRKDYLEGTDARYAVLRYSYENLIIMKLGYSFTYNSLQTSAPTGLYQTNGYQVRFNVETAGNLLYGASKLFHAQRSAEGGYSLFNVIYSQYAKVDFDYAKSFVIDDRNSLAFHSFLGIAVPYGNSTILPYEKRYFSGGANSVRGWSVRELGPGSYQGEDGKINFINQTGNIKLDLSVEYRTYLFWKFHAAAFIDAGNIWNTRHYADVPGGQFRFDRFYRQIAVAYGLGLRFNLDYFVLRLDGGMKAVNPAVEHGAGHYPLIHPRFSRDFTFHFAVGLPF